MIFVYLTIYYLTSGIICDLVYLYCNRKLYPQITFIRELELAADDYLWMPINWPFMLSEISRNVKALIREQRKDM